MSLYRWIIAGLWLLFVAYWAVAAVGAKRSTSRRRWRRAIGANLFWALLLVPVGAYFIYSARREETVMLQLFPEQYAAYMVRTRMLAPCPFRRR